MNRDARINQSLCSEIAVESIMKSVGRTLPCLLTLICVGMAGEARLVRAETTGFRAACVQVDITPEDSPWLINFSARRATGVLDRLYHRVVALDDGRTRFLLISSDTCGVTAPYYDQVCRKIKERTGIERRYVWWSVTHTHAAPSLPCMRIRTMFSNKRNWPGDNTQYATLFEQKLLQAIEQAVAQLEPARMGVGMGRSQANINRRQRLSNGRIRLGQNPDGPVDQTINLIRLERLDDSPIALIANYPIHGTVLGYNGRTGQGNTLISGDAPGVVAHYVEEKLGAPLVFIQGAAGNIAPIYSVLTNARRNERLSEFEHLLGDPIISANQSILSTTADVTLHVPERLIIESPMNGKLRWPAELSDYRGENDAGQGMVRFPISFLQINDDIMIWSAPCELFCEFALSMREQSPFKHTFYYGYTNGTFGYVPTRRAFAEGGYEPSTTVFTPQIETDLKTQVSRRLQELSTGRKNP